MKQYLLERRMDMLNLISKGANPSEVIEQLNEKYHTPIKTLWADWQNRHRWMPQIVQINDKTIPLQILQGLREVIRRAWFQHATAENEAVKLGALKLVKEAYRDFIELAQSLGLLKREEFVSQLKIIVEEDVTTGTIISQLDNLALETPQRTTTSPQEPSPL